MKQSKEVRNDVFHRVSHEHLVAVELNLVARYLDVVLDLREIEDTCEVERIIHIEMDMEQRFVCHRVECLIELVVVLICKICRLACPERFDLVDYVVLVSIDIFAIFPLLLLAEDYRYRHELAVFVQQTLDASFCCVLLLVFCDIKSDYSTSVSLVALFHLIFRGTVA